MQSSGPPYQGTVGAGVNYPERQYENQMSSRCHSASYPSYQPSSPYRPHPVSPQAHSHQYNSHGNHQMHSSMVYGTSHQLGPYDGTSHQLGPYASAPQAHFGASNQELYGSRHMYGNGSRNMQQVKAPWGESGGSTTSDATQAYSQPSSRPVMGNPPHMPPPSMRSPPHGTVNATPASSLAPAHHHYRSLPVGSSPSQSPHSWSQTQIPSPGVLHSPRTTPSPLPAHARSPGHSQPFSPPPTTPSPHHPPSSVTPHSSQPSSKIAASPPSSNCQTLNQTGSDPLQSLQKMVMLDSDTGESPMTRGSYEMPNSHAISQARSYFGSVEQLAGSNPGSPYPTYFNLDQNRLCTPPCTQILTSTTSGYSSIPDTVSNSSASSDSRTALSCADTTVAQQNGEISQSNSSEIKRDYEKVNSKDNSIVNGDGQQSGLDGTESSAPSQRKDEPTNDARDRCADWSNKVPAKEECSASDDAKDLTVSSSVCKRSNNHVDSEFCHSPQETIVEKQIKSRSILSPNKRNLVMQEVTVSNGPVGNGDESLSQAKFNCATSRWNNVETVEGRHHTTDMKDCCADEEPSVFEKQGVSATYFSPHSGNPCNLTWMKGDVKGMPVSKHTALDGSKSRTENGSVSERGVQSVSKIPPEETKPSVQKLEVGISNFLEKEERKELWQHPDLYVGPSPSEEKSQDDCVPNEPLGDQSIINTSLPLKMTPSEPPNVPLSENDQSKESKLSNSSTSRLPTKDSSNSARNDDCSVTNSQSTETTPRRKRGRPFGSKNKPKIVGEKPEKKSAKRKKGEIEQRETEIIKKKVKAFNGPYVHIVGTKEKPLSISVVNVAPKEEVKDIKYPKQKREFHLGNSLRKKLGMGHTSTLSPLYDAFTKDKTWICALCQKGSHYRSLGDLFGPYFFVEDQNSTTINSNSATTVGANKTEQKDNSVPNKNACLTRRIRSKRKRSELVEEFFKASMSKKAKQAKKPASETETSVAESSPLPSSTSPNSGNEFWIHEDCALWSHGVCLNGQRVHGVEEAVREASKMVCSKCKLNGATLGCLNKGCSEQYHFICATDKGCEMDEENFSLLCPRHRKRSHGEKRAVIE